MEALPDFEDYQLQLLHLYWSFYFGEPNAPLDVLTAIPVTRDARFLLWLHRWPLFDRFQNNPDFQDYLARIGVAQYADCSHPACGTG